MALKTEHEKLAALQARHSRLLAMLPADADAFADLDPDQLDDKLIDIEMITAEMLAVTNAQLAILDELARR
jgi:hypothetical protein